jgi:methionine-rich copper-binding protein CopC
MRKGGQLIAGVILLLASTTLFSQAAIAHTSVVKTDPTYKTTLTEMVDHITIEFTDTLMILGDNNVNTIALTAPDGSEVAIKGLSVIQNSITAQLPQSDFLDGTYIVNYRVVSADGHPVSGSYELYLNSPGTSVATTADDHEEHNGFFHVHQTHIIWAGIALIFIVLWVGYRRFNSEQGE